MSHVHQLEAVVLRLGEAVLGERAGAELGELDAHRVEGGVVEGGPQRLHGCGSTAPLERRGTVGVDDDRLLEDELRAGEHQLEHARREAGQELSVGRVGRDREADARRAQVPEDQPRRRVGLAAHGGAHLGEPADEPLVVRRPGGAPVGLVEVHVGEDQEVGDLLGLELGALGRDEDALARGLEVGRAAPRRRLQLLDLLQDGRAAGEVDPARLRLEGQHAVPKLSLIHI
eukprot:4895865-Prymnesium_polylepis.2